MHMQLVCKQENNENIAEIYIFLLYLFFDGKNLCFTLIFTRKKDKVLMFNIVHSLSFEISTFL